MFILYIFYFTDIIPDIIPGSCSDDETNVANVYLYIANLLLYRYLSVADVLTTRQMLQMFIFILQIFDFFVLRVCAKLVDTYHCDMSFVRC